MPDGGDLTPLKWLAASVFVLLLFGFLSQDVDRETAMAPDTPSVLMGTSYASR